jgi:hypothetical protein
LHTSHIEALATESISIIASELNDDITANENDSALSTTSEAIQPFSTNTYDRSISKIDNSNSQIVTSILKELFV